MSEELRGRGPAPFRADPTSRGLPPLSPAHAPPPAFLTLSRAPGAVVAHMGALSTLTPRQATGTGPRACLPRPLEGGACSTAPGRVPSLEAPPDLQQLGCLGGRGGGVSAGTVALELCRPESRADSNASHPTAPSLSSRPSRAPSSALQAEAALRLDEVTKARAQKPRQKGGWTSATSHPSHPHPCHPPGLAPAWVFASP